MRLRKLALLLVVAGLLCLPAPLYLSWAAEATAPPPRTSQVYAAEPIDPANETDRKRIVDRHAGAVALSIHQVSKQYSAGEYRSPNVTRRTLETAMETGSATTTDPGARADLRVIARNYTFIYDAYADDREYYRFHVREDGSVVEAQNISRTAVANTTVERATIHYESLSPAGQRTFDRILANSTEGEWGYRPRIDQPLTEELPALVRQNGTRYSVHVIGHVDDFGPGFGAFILGLGGTVVGILLVASGGIAYVLAARRQ